MSAVPRALRWRHRTRICRRNAGDRGYRLSLDTALIIDRYSRSSMKARPANRRTREIAPGPACFGRQATIKSTVTKNETKQEHRNADGSIWQGYFDASPKGPLLLRKLQC